MFTKEERWLLIESINHSIAYRLNNRTRQSEIKTLREAKKKLEGMFNGEVDNSNGKCKN